MTSRRWWSAGGLIAFVPVFGLATLHTPPGRTAMRWAAETTARSLLKGELRIGAVEGSPFGTLRLRDVELLDGRGQPAVQADMLEVKHRVGALFGGQVHIQDAQVHSLRLDLPRLMATLPTTDDEQTSGEPMLVRIDRAQLDATQIVFDTEVRVDNVKLIASVLVDGNRVDADIKDLQGDTLGRKFVLRGGLDWVDARVARLKAEARFGDITVQLRGVPTATGTFPIDGQVRWPAGALEGLIDTEPYLGPADLKVVLRGRPDRPRVELQGTVAGAQWVLTAHGALDRWQVKARATNFDPSHLDSSAPSGRLAMTVSATGRISPETLWPEGRLQASVRGRVRPHLTAPDVLVERGVLTAVSRGGRVTSQLRLDTTAGRIRARARMSTRGLNLDRAVVHLDRWQIGALLPPLADTTDIAGVATATVTAWGPLYRPAARGRIAVENLRTSAGRARRVDATVRWQGDAAAPTAEIDAAVHGYRHGSVNVHAGRVHAAVASGRQATLTLTATAAPPLGGLDVVATAVRTATATQMQWSRLVWRAPSATWNVKPGHLTYAGHRLEVPSFDARARSGTIRGRIDLDVRHPLGPRSAFELDLDDLDMATLTGLVPGARSQPRGTIDAILRFDGRRPRVAVRADLRRVGWSPSVPRLTSQIRARLTAQDAQIVAIAHGRRWGTAKLNARARPPRDWRQPSAWAQLPPSSVQRLAASVDVNLDGLPALQQWIPGLEGRARADVDLGPGAEALSATVTASLRAPNAPDIRRLVIKARGDAHTVDAEAKAEIGQHRASSLKARLEHGLPTLLAAPSLSTLRGYFRADVVGFPVKLLGLRAPSAPDGDPISGEITVRAQGGHGAHGPILVGFARGQDIRLVASAPPIRVAAQGHLNRYVTTATATFSAPELGRHRIAVRARTPGAVAARGPSPNTWVDRIDALSIRSDSLAVSALRAFGVATAHVQGRIDARLHTGRALSNATATVAVHRLQLSPAVAPIDLKATLTEGPRGVDVAGQARLGAARLLAARGRVPAGLAELVGLIAPASRTEGGSSTPLAFSFEGRGFPLARAFIDAADRRDVEGRLWVKGTVAGTLQSPAVQARITVDDLRLGETRFDRFELEHQDGLAGRSTTLNFMQHAGGALHAKLHRSDARLTGTLRARTFRLDFLSALANLTDAGAGIAGRLDGELDLIGPLASPKLAGAMAVDQIRFVLPNVPPVDGGRLDLRVSDRIAKVDLAAASGPGTVKANLRAELPTLTEPRFAGTFALEDVPVVAQGMILGVNLKGQLAGFRSATDLDAEVVLRDADVRIPDATPRTLHPIPHQADVVFREGRWPSLVPRMPEPISPRRFTIRVRTGSPLRVRGQPVQAMFGVNLVAKGRPSGTSVAGDVRVAQGAVTLFGRRYTVDRADVVLSGRQPSDPRIDLRLSHKFEACTFFVDVVGSLDEPKIRLSAVPDIFDDRQLFGFLFGASPDGDRPDKNPAQQSLDLAAWLLLDQVRTRVKQALPFDTLAVDLGEGTDTGQANVTLGKWLTDQLFVAYAYHHGAARGENTSEGRLQYRFFRSWLLEMVFGDRGNGGADVLWTRRW